MLAPRPRRPQGGVTAGLSAERRLGARAHPVLTLLFLRVLGPSASGPHAPAAGAASGQGRGWWEPRARPTQSSVWEHLPHPSPISAPSPPPPPAPARLEGLESLSDSLPALPRSKPEPRPQWRCRNNLFQLSFMNEFHSPQTRFGLSSFTERGQGRPGLAGRTGRKLPPGPQG